MNQGVDSKLAVKPVNFLVENINNVLKIEMEDDIATIHMHNKDVFHVELSKEKLLNFLSKDCGVVVL